MTDVEIHAIKGVSHITANNYHEAYSELVEAYRSLMQNVSQLKDVIYYHEVGLALFLLLTYDSVRRWDIDLQQRIVSVSYLFLSIAINKFPESDPFSLQSFSSKMMIYRHRVLLIEYFREPMMFTVMSQLEHNGELSVGLSQIRQYSEALDALGCMQYADVLACKGLMDSEVMKIQNKLEHGLLPMMHKDLSDMMLYGIKNRIQTLAYVKEKVLDNEDLDF